MDVVSLGLAKADAARKYSRAELPSYVGLRTRRFDPARSLYNFKGSNTRRLRSKLAAARAGTGLCNIGCAGDSLTVSQGATPGTNDYPKVLRTLLSERGYPVGTGLVYAFKNNGAGDTRWTSSGWGAGSVTAPFWNKNGAGATGTYTSDLPGTVLDIVTLGTSAPFTYAIDGGAATAIVPNGQQAPQITTITGLPNTTHTVVFSSVSGINYLIAAGVRGTTGVQVANAGVGGSTAGNWLNPGANAWFAPLSLLLGTSPDVVLLELGMNEANQAIAPATYKANLTTIVQTIQAAGVDVLLCASHSPSTTGGTGASRAIPTSEYQALVSAAYDVADARDVPLLDLTDRLGLFTTLNGYGLASDALHLNPAGYAAKAAAWLATVTA